MFGIEINYTEYEALIIWFYCSFRRLLFDEDKALTNQQWDEGVKIKFYILKIKRSMFENTNDDIQVIFVYLG
jgi:hypothetical protein